MARPLFDTNDPGVVKKWSAKAMAELTVASYFIGKMTGTEEQRLPIALRNDLESGPGDEVTLYLVAKIVGAPIRGNDKAEGRERRLTDATFKLKIDRFRQPINVGDLMAQKRRPYDLTKMAATRVGEYWGEYLDEEFFVHLSGQRGTGDNIQHLEPNYAGWPNAVVAPDADHLLYPVGATNEATLGDDDTMTRSVIERATLRAETMRGGGADKPKQMQMCSIEGEEYWVHVMHGAQMHDLRMETGEAGWLALEKARITAQGIKTPIFQGQAGAKAILNRTLLCAHNSITYRSNYGPGSNVIGMRSLFMGAHAGVIAFGTNDRNKNGVRLAIGETKVDLEDETVLKSATYMGVAKTRYHGKDFGLTAIDTGISEAARTAMAA